MAKIKDTKPVLSVPEEYGNMIEDLLRAELDGLVFTSLHLHQTMSSLGTMEFLKTSNLAQIVAPAGSGKTGILCLLIYLLRAIKTMILTPSVVISRQIAQAIAFPLNDATFFERAKIYEPNETKENKEKILLSDTVIEDTSQIKRSRSDVVIVNGQKLVGNSKRAIQKKEADAYVKENLTEFFGSFSLLIVDEAHRFPTPSWKAIIQEFIQQNPNGKLIFLTATPYRNLNGREIRILDEKFESYNIKKSNLQRGVVRPLVFKELRASSTSAENMMKDLANKLFQSLDEHDRKENRFKHQAMVLVQNKKQAFEMEEIFNKLKKNSTKAIVGGNKLPRNVSAIEEFTRGKFSIALVCGMLKEGYDNPHVSICVVHQNLRSRPTFEQFLGRCTRRVMFQGDAESGDKTEAMLISYAHFGIKKVWEKLDNAPPEETIDIEFIREFAQINVHNAGGNIPKEEVSSRESDSENDDVGVPFPAGIPTSSPGEEKLPLVSSIKPEIEGDIDDFDDNASRTGSLLYLSDESDSDAQDEEVDSSRRGKESDSPQTSRNGGEPGSPEFSGSENASGLSSTSSEESDTGSGASSSDEGETAVATTPKPVEISILTPSPHAENANQFRDNLDRSTCRSTTPLSEPIEILSRAKPGLEGRINVVPKRKSRASEPIPMKVSREISNEPSTSRANPHLNTNPAVDLQQKNGSSGQNTRNEDPHQLQKKAIPLPYK